jgi:uncharacterized protein (TIGR02246 family)
MRLGRGLLVVAVVVMPFTLHGQSGPTPSKADVQKLLDQRIALRNSGDFDRFVESYTPDATILSSDGLWQRGRAELLKAVRDRFGSGVYKGVQSTLTVDSVQAIAPNVILVDYTWELNNIPGGGSRKGQAATTLVKSGETWRTAAERNMVPTPAGALKTRP